MSNNNNIKNKIKYKAVIFDLDGTILDTSKDLANSVNYALEKNGFPTISDELAVQYTGNGWKALIKRAIGCDVGDEIFNRVFEDFKEDYSIHSEDNTLPYDGIPELLSHLKGLGIPMAVLSNKKHPATVSLISKFFNGIFTLVFGEGGDIPKKPDTGGFKKIMELLEIDSPKNILYVGDSEVDVQTVKNAGCDGIFVPWGFRTRNQLIQAGAKIIANSPNDILGKIINQ